MGGGICVQWERSCCFRQNGLWTLQSNKRLETEKQGYRTSLNWFHFCSKDISLLVFLWNSGQPAFCSVEQLHSSGQPNSSSVAKHSHHIVDVSCCLRCASWLNSAGRSQRPRRPRRRYRCPDKTVASTASSCTALVSCWSTYVRGKAATSPTPLWSV
jgi:hypothetical protein